MAEAEEAGSVGDWRCLISSPSSNTIFSSLASEAFAAAAAAAPSKPFSRPLDAATADPPSAAFDRVRESDRAGVCEEGGVDRGGEEELCDWKPPAAETAAAGRNGGSIAERRAARCGFNAPRLNTARFRSVSPLSSPAVRSPYLTIPPGLSPTALLDSPVMLPNSQAQPSPTTGTFPLPSFGQESLIPLSVSSSVENDKSDDCDSSIFKPHVKPVTMPCPSNVENQVPPGTEQVRHLPVPDIRHQNFAQGKTQADFECPVGFLNQAALTNYVSDFPEIEVSNNMIVKANCMPLETHALVASGQAVLCEQQPVGDDANSQRLLEEDQKGALPCSGIGKPSEDGYNWRKYGQKQVKGSEYPRSYYKCTHPNCQVKKKVERSHDGQITEIIYKGAHHHPKPQPSRRSAIGSAFPLSETSEMVDCPGSYVKVDGGSVWRSIQQGPKDKANIEGRADGLERTSSTSAVTELSDPLSTAHGKHLGVLDSADTPELSSTLASHDDEEDRATQGSISLGDDAEDEESLQLAHKQIVLVLHIGQT